jgi:predicted Rossmann-fold nucleotide-binding protein
MNEIRGINLTMGYHPLEYEPRAAFLPFHERVQRWAVNVCTGAASGIGEAGARRFAEEGARVVGADLAEIPGRDPTPRPSGSGISTPSPASRY